MRGMTADRWTELRRVFVAMQPHPMGVTRDDLCKALRETSQAVSNRLQELKVLGYAATVSRGRYAKWVTVGDDMPFDPPKPKPKPKPKPPKPPKPKKARSASSGVRWYSEGVKLDDLAAAALEDGHDALYRALRQAATESMLAGG